MAEVQAPRRGRGRGARRGGGDEGLREQIRVLTARLEAVEAGRRRDPELGDESEAETVAAAEASDEEAPELRLLRSILLASSKPKTEISNYDGSLSADILLDWISELDKYFENEEIKEDKKVKFATTKLKGHALLWWDNVQADRKRLNKIPIRNWARMVAKLKGRFLPKDYQVDLCWRVQNLRQKGMTVKEYTEEFYRVNLRAGYTDETPEKTARYVNSLRMEILDEISILSPRNIEEAFQSAVKAEEKINRKQNNRRGRGSGRGRGQSYGRGKSAANSEEGSSSKTSGTTDKGDSTRGGRSYQRGRGNGHGGGTGFQCYRCQKWGHRSFECPEVEQAGQRGTYMVQPEEADAQPREVEDVAETGEALLLNKVLLKPIKEVSEPTQRKSLFRTVCKSHGKCCKYDRRVTHAGKTNCYKFTKDGVKHTLVPIKEEDSAESSGTKALLLGGKQFIKQIDETEVNFAVVKRMKPVLLSTERTELPKEVQELLEKFHDIAAEELPDKLPPKRSISHHIDFIPGVSLPNKAAYRMSPKDNEEVRKQV
eukprot:PITA_03108